MSVQINVQASQSALAQSIAQGVAAFNSRYAGQNQLNLQINARSFSQPLGRITSDLADFESALKASNARVLAFGASTAVLGGVVRSFKEIANVTLEVEKSLTDINRVLNLSTSGLQKFSSELFNVSKQTASSFDDASKAALEFSRQGLNTEETLKRTADALTLVRLTGISSTKAVEDLTATINGFAKAGLTTSQVVNKLAAVEQDFAVSASDLTEALSRTGQAAQEAGVSFDELNALVTTAQQNTARGGAVIGNALKTIFTRLQRTETLDQLENFNIAVRDVEGNILPAVQILKNFADQYNNLADAQRAQLSEQVAGVYQVNILKGVIKDLNNNQGTYVQALQRGAMAANEAEIANQRLNKTLSALVTQTGVGLQQLANNVGKVTFAPIFEAIVSPVNDAVSYINDTLEGEGIGSVFANGLLKGVRNVIAGPGLAVAFAVIAKVAKNTFEDATKALPAILGLTTEAQKRANIEKSIISILQTQSNLSLALQGQQGNLSTQAATVLNYARLQTAQYQQQLQVAQQLAPLLAAQNVTVGTRGIQVGPRIKAGGHIPAFAEMSERMGAAMGGYKSGKVVKAPKSIGANTYMNSAEEVKYVAGFAQPFINPPAGSKAGRAHRQNAISRTGVDPYMNSGFIPNFALTSAGTETSREWTDQVKVRNNPLVTSKTNVGPKFFDLFVADINKKQLNVSIDAIRKEAKDVVKEIYLKKRDRTGELSGLAYQPEKLRAFINKYKDQVDPAGLARTETGLKNINKTSGYSYAINQVQGLLGEAEAYKELKDEGYKPTVGNQYFDLSTNDGRFAEVRTRKTVSIKDILNKAILQHLSTTEKTYNNTKNDRIFTGNYDLITPTGTAFNASGFIPNFAPPTSAIRVPWFKKFGNASFDAVQPTLGISKASDVDTFRSSQFRSKAFDKAAIDGDPNLFAPLYEDFAFKAMQLISRSDIKDDLMRGYVLQPGTDQKQSALDAVYRKKGIGVEYKGYPKKNLTGTIGGELKRKYETLSKTNPEEAAKLQELIIAFNEVGHENQLPSDFGKNFTQLAGTSYSQMVKNSPDLVKGLSAETNMLLNRYVKDPAFLAMSAAKGFIPNFASGTDIYKGYAFNNTGKIYNDLYHSDAWDSIEGSTAGAIKYAYHNNKLLLQTNKAISPILKKAFLSRGVPESAFSPVEDVDFMMRLKNKKEIDDKLKNLGSVQLSSGIQAILEKGYYRKLIKGQQSYNIPGGVSPEELKIFGGVDGWVKWQEQNYGPLKWDSHASGFIPNFANQDFEILREIIRLNKLGAISNNRYTSSEEDDKNNITRLYRGVKGISERWNSIDKNNPQAINKAIFEKQSGNKIMNEKEFVNKSFSNLAFSHRLNWPDETENPIPFLSTSKKEDVADMFAAPSGLKGSIAIKNSRLLGNERRYENLYKKYGKEKVKGILYKLSKTGGGKGLGLDFVDAYNSGNAYKSYGNEGEIGLFSRGFIPNLANFIDVDTLGKNSVHYSGDLMKLIKDIESSIGRHLTSGELRALTNPKANLSKLNDPKVLNKFINSENKGGFAGFAKGFLPNFAYKQAVMGLEESMSGNKAVFDSKPFPHIRNKSQPTFSSAIADHGGLSNALSDSMRGQKNAGLMNRGFIPNFVNPQLSESKLLSAFPTGTQFDSKLKKVLETLNKNLNKLATDTKLTDKQIQILERNTIKCANYIAASGVGAKALSSTQAALSEANKNLLTARKEEVQNKNKQRLNQVSTTLAFAGPIVAGLVEQVLYGNKQRFEMTKGERVGQSLSSTGLTSLSTGASLGGSIGGLPGAIVGSLLGLGVAIMSASQAAKLSAEELQSLADQTKSTTQNTISFGNAYIEALKTFQTSTDPEIIKKASISLADSFQAIVDINLQKQFKDAGDDISKLSKILFEYETSKKQITKLQEERALVQQLKPAGSELLNEALGNSAPAKEGERKRAALLGTSNKNEIDTALVIRFSGLFSDLSKLNQTQIQELQKTILENAEDANKIFEKISSFADKDNQALFSLGQSNEISQVIAEMQGSNFGAGKGLTGKIPADISFYTNLYRKKSASPNKLDPQQIQDQADLSAAYKDLLQSTILQVGFENDTFKLIQERLQIEQDYSTFLSKNLLDKKGVLQDGYAAMRKSVYVKTRTSLKEKESSIIQDYLKFFETAPADKRKDLKDTFITQQAPAQKSFIERMPQTRLEFEKTMQENMGTNYNKDNLNALYEATQKYRQEEENINNLNRISLETESIRFNLAKKRLDREQDFLLNLKSAYIGLADDGKELTAQLGRNLPRMFADGLVDGIKAAIKESDNLGQALMGIAAKFLDEISTIMMRSSIYQILGSFLPSAIPTNPGSPGMTSKQKGGYIRAQSGMYISGTGSGDKYPAMLENGEYVLNRRAVMAMGGPSALDSLNFSAAPRFAAGGSFGNDFNDISSMESNMTTYGLEQSQLYNELRDSERQKQAEGVRKRQKRKAEQRALIGSVIAAVATAAIAAGVSNVASNIKTEGDVSFTEKMNAQGGPKTEAEYFKQQSLVQKGIATPSMPGVQSRYTGPTPQTGFASIFSGPTKGQTWYQKAGSAISKPFGKGKKQTGGLIGSRLSDTIPGYMEGGLYSSPMVKKYGTGMQNGGSSVMAAGNNGSTVNNNTNASNSFNFNTSVQRDGKIEIGSNSTSYVQQDVELSQSLNTKVYEVVLDTIRKEKRFGGSLAGARNA